MPRPRFSSTLFNRLDVVRKQLLSNGTSNKSSDPQNPWAVSLCGCRTPWVHPALMPDGTRVPAFRRELPVDDPQPGAFVTDPSILAVALRGEASRSGCWGGRRSPARGGGVTPAPQGGGMGAGPGVCSVSAVLCRRPWHLCVCPSSSAARVPCDPRVVSAVVEHGEIRVRRATCRSSRQLLTRSPPVCGGAVGGASALGLTHEAPRGLPSTGGSATAPRHPHVGPAVCGCLVVLLSAQKVLPVPHPPAAAGHSDFGSRLVLWALWFVAPPLRTRCLWRTWVEVVARSCDTTVCAPLVWFGVKRVGGEVFLH